MITVVLVIAAHIYAVLYLYVTFYIFTI